MSVILFYPWGVRVVYPCYHWVFPSCLQISGATQRLFHRCHKYHSSKENRLYCDTILENNNVGLFCFIREVSVSFILAITGFSLRDSVLSVMRPCRLALLSLGFPFVPTDFKSNPTTFSPPMRSPCRLALLSLRCHKYHSSKKNRLYCDTILEN
jgi:hypothetical protein